jgi:hypothetical protein
MPVTRRPNGEHVVERIALVGSPPGPVERVVIATPELPCGGCAHAAVCSIRPLLDPASLAVRGPDRPHEAIRIGVRITLECDHYLAAQPASVNGGRPTDAERMAASRRRGAAALPKARASRTGAVLPKDRGERNALVAETLRSTSSRTAAALKLGVSPARVDQVIAEMREEGSLPADVAQTLAARFGKRAAAEAPA